MPFLRLTLQPAPGSEVSARLASQLTQLMATKLGKKAELTSVLVEAPAAALWTIGGAAATKTAMLEVSITEGTNNAVEKSDFIAAAHRLLCNELPALEPIAYIVLKEVPAENWGYDGRTQAARRTAATA